MDPIGTTLGNYRIEAPLGAGGTGQIFRAVHVHLNRPVALKILHPQFAADPSFRARFLQEARSAAALHHPNIIEIYDFGEENGRYYLVMELITAGSVRTLLSAQPARSAPLDLGLAVDLVRQAARGLGYAHRHGMVHRDVKPDNLLLVREDNGAYTVKVTDFGLARLAEGGVQTAAGTAMGTPIYMSPEQCQGIDLDARSDIYSLGITLYELCTGYVPFQVRTISEAVFKHVNTPAPSPREVRPNLPVGLERVILRCLEKKPDERYATAEELIAALDALGEELGTATVVPGGAGQPTALQTPEEPRILLRHETAAFTPGVAAVVTATLVNPGRREQRVRVTAEGIPIGWLTLPGEIALPPGAQRDVPIGVLVPRDPAVHAGEYPVTLRAATAENPTGGSTAAARWAVLPFSAGSLDVAPQRGAWLLTVVNGGNAPATFGLHALDDAGLLDYTITPPSLRLEPGERGQATLRARTRGDDARGTVPFRVEARSGDGPPLTGSGSFRAGGRGFGAPLWALAAGVAVLGVGVAALLSILLGGDDEGGTATATTAASATPTVATVVTATGATPTAVAATATAPEPAANATAPANVVTPTPPEPTATFTPTATATPTPAPRYPTGVTVWRAAGDDFASWQPTGVALVSDGTLALDTLAAARMTDAAGYYLDVDYLLGEALGPETVVEPFTYLVASWNAFTPLGTAIETLVSVRVDGRWTGEYSLGIWAESAEGGLRKSVAGQEDADGMVDVDTLILNAPADAFRLKVRFLSFGGDATPRLQNIAVAAYPAPATPAALEPGDPARWGRTLQVPVCSNTHTPRDDSNGTAVAMVLAYWDGAPNECATRVPHAAEGIFDFVYGRTGNWPFATAYAVATHPTFEAYVVRFPSLAEAERWIAAGVPIVFSSEGRLAVLAGFTAEGDVIVNEPRVDSDGAPRAVYDRATFETAWLSTTSGIGYIIYPAGTPIPTR